MPGASCQTPRSRSWRPGRCLRPGQSAMHASRSALRSGITWPRIATALRILCVLRAPRGPGPARPGGRLGGGRRLGQNRRMRARLPRTVRPPGSAAGLRQPVRFSRAEALGAGGGALWRPPSGAGRAHRLRRLVWRGVLLTMVVRARPRRPWRPSASGPVCSSSTAECRASRSSASGSRSGWGDQASAGHLAALHRLVYDWRADRRLLRLPARAAWPR